MVRLIDRYVGRTAVLGILMVWVTVTVLAVIFTLLGELNATRADYSSGDAVWFVAQIIPRLAYQVFPISALLGAMVGVGGLAAGNELVAFRSSGASRLRLAGAALAGTLAMTLLVMAMGEWVAPPSEARARAFRLSETVGRPIIGGPRGMWIRDGNSVVNIQTPVLSANRGRQSVYFNNVAIYLFSLNADLLSVTRAQNAVHDGTGWTLNGVSLVTFDDAGAVLKRAVRQEWRTDIRPELLSSAVTRPALMSMRQLWAYMSYLGENGLDDSAYREIFWEKAAYPFVIVALVLAGMPFLFGQQRSHSLGLRLFYGMALGGSFMVVNRAIQKFGGVYELPPSLTTSLPILLLLAGAIVALRRSV